MATSPIPLFTVIRPGLLTSVQDLGRRGYADIGVSTGGALDGYSLRVANALAGNPPDAAALEITLLGPELRAETALVAAIAGADLSPRLDNQAIGASATFSMEPGQVLSFGRRTTGARAYLAVAGGFAVAPVMGSRATFIRAGFGGIEGRALRPADTLQGRGAQPCDYRRIGWTAPVSASTESDRKIRFLPGPHPDSFPDSAMQAFCHTTFIVSHQSDRMGFRLDGEAVERNSMEVEMRSEAVALGAIQVPPDGKPIVLMAERQTTGGYPLIGVVIASDIPTLAQRAPGDPVRFTPVTLAQAHAAWQAMQAELAVIEIGGRLR